LQARAREQQMGLTNEQRMHHINGNLIEKSSFKSLTLNQNFQTDPNVQLQISTSLNDGSMSPVASPSPNSRNQFVAPANKGRMMMNPQSPSSGFQHPGRPVSTQLQRQQSQQRMNQSPFSPQMTPQSPHDAFPGSPSSDGFARPNSDDQFMHSPQTPKPSVQQQSPVHIPSVNFNMNQNQNQPQQPIIRPLDNMSGGYVQQPGTPRPSFNPGQTRTTVYARPDMFSKPPFIGGQRGDVFSPPSVQSPQSPQDQTSNRQLRDLLQRQQSAPPNIGAPSIGAPANIVSQSGFTNEQVQVQNPQQPQNIPQVAHSDNTFRQPLPPGMRQQRMPMVGGQMIRTNVAVPRMQMNQDLRPRMGIRPGQVLNPQQMHQVQQQNQMGLVQQRIINPQNAFNQMNPGDMMQQGQTSIIATNQGQMMPQQNQNVMSMQQSIQNSGAVHAAPNEAIPTAVTQPADGEGIPDSVTAELEKLEQDENVAMDGVGDILGGLGDDDDDLLDSLTAEMGADFNILEYADPELEGDDEKNNLLDSLELDDHGDHSKEEKMKLEAEKLAKAQLLQQQQQQQQQAGANMQQIQGRIIPPIQGQQNVINQIPTNDGQNPNQIPNQPQVMNQIPGQQQQQQQLQQQQIVMNPQQQGMNNFQRQPVRIKTMIPPNQIPEIQQIHQQMMLQVSIFEMITFYDNFSNHENNLVTTSCC
jgi:[histone H3]-lysine4 N-trimethyltransferase MLL3